MNYIKNSNDNKENPRQNLDRLSSLLRARTNNQTSNLRPIVACIDDSKTVQRQVQMTLEPAGYQVFSITDPTTSLTELVRKKPVLILLDINMPGIDGRELCVKLRRSRILKDIPIVMLTGANKEIDRTLAKFVGANDYITKPFDPNELIRVVKKLALSTSAE